MSPARTSSRRARAVPATGPSRDRVVQRDRRIKHIRTKSACTPLTHFRTRPLGLTAQREMAPEFSPKLPPRLARRRRFNPPRRGLPRRDIVPGFWTTQPSFFYLRPAGGGPRRGYDWSPSGRRRRLVWMASTAASSRKPPSLAQAAHAIIERRPKLLAPCSRSRGSSGSSRPCPRRSARPRRNSADLRICPRETQALLCRRYSPLFSRPSTPTSCPMLGRPRFADLRRTYSRPRTASARAQALRCPCHQPGRSSRTRKDPRRLRRSQPDPHYPTSPSPDFLRDMQLDSAP